MKKYKHVITCLVLLLLVITIAGCSKTIETNTIIPPATTIKATTTSSSSTTSTTQCIERLNCSEPNVCYEYCWTPPAGYDQEVEDDIWITTTSSTSSTTTLEDTTTTTLLE
jgi:hypothetical protein